MREKIHHRLIMGRFQTRCCLMHKNGGGRGFCNIEIDLDRLAMFSSRQAALDQFRQFQPFFGYIVVLTILKNISQWEGLSPYFLQT